MTPDKTNSLDILFINGYHREFIYIPMGTFGICDYLERNGFRTKIINLSIYPVEEYINQLFDYISHSNPRYISIILHWKELLNSVIKIGDIISKKFPHIPIIVGGLTASYYPYEILQKLDFVDYVIQGDPEIPFRKILSGTYNNDVIENTYYREKNTIIKSPLTFVADRALLNNVSFSKLTFLENYPQYLEKLDNYLGFPIFIGRGCMYDCEYCGGSKSAFKIHSNRHRIAVRDTNQIISDIKILYNEYQCRNILISHTTKNCKKILSSLNDGSILDDLIINVEPWDRPDLELITLFQLFSDKIYNKIASLLLTPKIEKQTCSSSDFHENITRYIPLIQKFSSNNARCHVNLFFGYFTSRHTRLSTLYNDMTELHNLRCNINLKNMEIIFLALSSDPGSPLNEKASKIISGLNLPSINHAILFDRNLSKNILLHRPKKLSRQDADTFERNLQFSELVYHDNPLLYWALTHVLGYKKYLSLINSASTYYYYSLDYQYYEIFPTSNILVINCINQSIQKIKPFNRFLSDILNFCLFSAVASRISRYDNFSGGVLPDYLTLNKDRVFLSDYNFMPALHKTENGEKIGRDIIATISQEKDPSLYLYVNYTITRFPKDEIELLSCFDGLTHNEILIKKMQQKSLTKKYIKSRIITLYQQGILISS